MTTNRRFRRAAASEYILENWGLRYAPTTLAKLACVGGGPVFEHFGRWPVYRQEDLDSWVTSRLSGRKCSTSSDGITSKSGTEVTRP